MGRQVATSGSEIKANMTLSTVAAGSVAGADDELRLWVGDNVLLRKVEWHEDARTLMDAWIEDSCPLATGAATNFTTYRVNVDAGKGAIVKVASGLVPTVTENEVVLIISRTYAAQPAAGGAGNRDGTRPGLPPYPVALSGGAPGVGRSQGVRGRFEKALEALLEDRKAA